jgi:hypothetical protein
VCAKSVEVGTAEVEQAAAGMPCPKCNLCDLENPPRPPAGTRIDFDKKGWRH